MIYTILQYYFRGDCCSYKSQLNAIDGRGNMRKESIDFSGGNAFNTTVENFEVLSKPSSSPKKVKDNMSHKSDA